ncbi:MAG: ExeA family protein [Gammaproteobacteria bacterium]
MYLEHYNLRKLPFTITSDTEFFMNRAGYQDALNVLLVALRSGEGFVKVTGEVGVGKTLLCRKLLNSLKGEYVTAFIYNPYLQPDTLLFAIADELGVSYETASNQHILQKRITKALLSQHAQGKRVVLCLDEVQAMPVRTLETLRLLTNIETEKRKLLQVVLFGQPELDVLLEQPSVRQLKQRITFSYKLKPLNRTAMKTYIRHRLAVAGYKGRELFTNSTLDTLHHASGGLPRMINILAHKALLVAYGRGDHVIKNRHLQAAVEDSPEARRSGRLRLFMKPPAFLRWLYGTLGMSAFIVILVQVYR